MVRHNQGRYLALFLILSVFAVASCKSAERPTFLPRGVTDAATKPAVSSLKTLVANDAISTSSRPPLASRGGAIAIPLPAKNEVTGACVFLVLDYLFRKAFKANGIKFPSQLGGCCILFVVMLVAEVVKPGLGDGVFNSLTPGAGFLAKWLPVFFVPGLAMLPLAPSMGSSLEVSFILLN